MTKANSPHPLSEIAPAIGKITLVWNDIHLFVFSIFWRLNGGAAKRSKAIFFAARADRTQRDMTTALIQAEMELVPELRDAAVAVLADVGRMSGRRNDVIHAMWAYDADWENGVASVFEPSGARLSRKRLGEELTKLYEDMVRLDARLSTINRQVIGFCEIRDRWLAQHPQSRALPDAGRATQAEGDLPAIP
jgi:hypothetical protein